MNLNLLLSPRYISLSDIQHANMKEGDIPIHNPTLLPASPGLQKLRAEARDYFKALIKPEGAIGSISSVSDMIPLGGRNSACYFYRNNDWPEVVKFGFSLLAEGQILSMLAERGVAVPTLIYFDLVPGSANSPSVS